MNTREWGLIGKQEDELVALRAEVGVLRETCGHLSDRICVHVRETEALRRQLDAIKRGFKSTLIGYGSADRLRWYHNGMVGPTLNAAISAEVKP